MAKTCSFSQDSKIKVFKVNYLCFTQRLKEPIYKNIDLHPQIFENLIYVP